VQDLRTLLSDDDLAALRAAFDRDAISRAASDPFAVLYPPLDNWVKETSATFFERSEMAPRDRERCILVMLTINGAMPMSFAIHLYWALMEGLSIDDLCQTITLVAAYGGVPRVAFGMTILQGTLNLLRGCVAAGKTQSSVVVSTFIAELR
jgi:alkylhydroperoxidase/carboxymuconolactone decarboxylase family protein YurZ